MRKESQTESEISATEVAKSGTVCHSLATRVGQPRSGAQVLVLRTKTNFVGKADEVATFSALGVINNMIVTMDGVRNPTSELRGRSSVLKT